MAENRASIEERLSQLVQDAPQKSIFDRFPFKILVVALWVIFIGIAGVCIYFSILWITAGSDMHDYKNKIIQGRADIQRFGNLSLKLTKEIGEMKVEITALDLNISDYAKNNSALRTDVNHLKETINRVRNETADTQNSINKEKAETEELEARNKKLDDDVKNAMRAVEEIKVLLANSTKSLSSWKLFSAAGFFGSSLAALGSFMVTGELATSRKHLAHAKIMKESFNKLSDKFVEFLYLMKDNPATRRLECFRWQSRGVLSDCLSREVLVTNIKTSAGYRFGIVTKAKWVYPETEDKEAFAFSANKVESLRLPDGGSLKIVINGTHLRFGETDLVLNLITGIGTSSLKAFGDKVDPRFFTPEAQFTVDELSIAHILFTKE